MNKYLPMLGKTIFSIDMFKECFSEGDLINTDDTIGDTEKEFIKKFNSLPKFCDKMKALCESSFSESEISVILDQIPLTYKKYYQTLGPERCRANGYNITDLKKECDDLFVAKDVKEAIYKNFNEGNKYSLKELKEKLRVLYENIGYNKTPKAVDINNYFETERVRIKGNEGLKLIKKK